MNAIKYIDEYNVEQTVTEYTVVTATDTAWTAGFYVVESNTVINNSVTVTGDVKLILADGVTLTVNASETAGAAGICVTNADPTATTGLNTFTVYGQTAGSGQLIATGGSAGAGIGGGLGAPGSHITLAGGTVVATGGTSGGAGIGGGRTSDAGAVGNGTDIKVTGGTVIATGKGGAGIGGGYRNGDFTGGSASNIAISGGVVDARSEIITNVTDEDHCSAGIGGGYAGNGANITISGGTVKATSTERGAGIGAGGYGFGSNITISGGTVTATSVDGAGIGGGYKKSASNVKITGGTVTATSTNGDAIGNALDLNDTASSKIYVNTAASLKAGADAASAKDVAHATGTDIATSLVGKKYAASQTSTVDYVDETGKTQTLTGDYTLIQAGSDEAVTWTAGWYVVGADYNNDGVINAEDAQVAGKQTSFTITGGATVNGAVKLILVDGFSLTVDASESTYAAGIKVNAAAANTFAVYGQTAGTGMLTATGNGGGAGIGGSNGYSSSGITIAGGTIVAVSGIGGAGIGGGNAGTGSDIKITGGVVDAQSTGSWDCGAGIGGGSGKGASNITISGGTVLAKGVGAGAGIGGGKVGSFTGGTITGGVVVAKGSYYSAGIGGGNEGAASGITISGGNVTASSTVGAGIGGGSGKNASDITISGGTVTTTSATGAGIGGGTNGGTGTNITIKGGLVNVTSSAGAGIGGGYQGTASGITISGGTITATGGVEAIGKGQNGSAATDIFVNTEVVLKAGTSATSTTTIAHTTGTSVDALAGQKYASAALLPEVSFIDEDGAEVILGGYTATLPGTGYTLINADSASAVTWSAGYYVVGADYDGNGVINAEDAQVAGKKTDFTITGGAIVSGAVKLILVDGFSLTVDASEATNAAGVKVSATATDTFTVYGQTAGTGKLTATGGTGSAGIGGNTGYSSSGITLAGGTVVAIGGSAGAGIGGGAGGTGSDIKITGGVVDAQSIGSWNCGAGIGGGSEAAASNITITGGTVLAKGAGGGAGIGGGKWKSFTGGTITGGVVIATALNGAGGAGIGGGGGGGTGSDITITGGTIIATGAVEAIGKGKGGAAATNILVNTEVILKAGASATSTTTIAHTTGTSVDALAGQKYASAVLQSEVSFIDENGATVILGSSTSTLPGTEYTLINADSDSAVTWSAGYYVVGADYDGNGVINAADAALGKNNFTITGGAVVSGDVKLILADGFSLTVDASATTNAAGIKVTDADADVFTVYGQTAGTGMLSATGNGGGAGIGGSSGQGASGITIAGGTVVAVGGATGAGIGGGYLSNASDITVAGGTVIATGTGGAGIGGGYGYWVSAKQTFVGGTFTGGTITGGVVTARSESGAGIGAGYRGLAQDIVITGGTVNAASSNSGAGIGSGQQGTSASGITISGGTVVASGGTGGGAGIGGGYLSSASDITISGGVVIADGGDYGAGIGSGKQANASNITISGGTVNATGNNGAGIGGGQGAWVSPKFNGGTFTGGTITGGVVTAHSENGGAGIGGGYQGLAQNIVITGGSVTASSSSSSGSNKGGAGIGGGYGGAASGITISGGSVVAIGAPGDAGSNLGGAGIGGGGGGSGSNITISGGFVDARSQGTWVCGAGIGGGGNGSGSGITISGGTVLATGTGAGAAIGGGREGSASDITITDGIVSASSSGGSVIGAGNGKAGTNIHVAEDITVRAGTTKGTWSFTSGAGGHTDETELGTDLAGKKYASVCRLVGGTLTTATTFDGEITRVEDCTATKMIFGGTISSTGGTVGIISDGTVSIGSGSFGNSIACGSASRLSTKLAQTGDLELTIEGGTFAGRVAGGMYVADGATSATPSTATATLDGNVKLTITGGTFNGRIYGGCNAQKDAYGVQSTIEGSVSVTVDSSKNVIAINNYLIGGSRGATNKTAVGSGRITGDVTVTFTGLGSNLAFNGGTSVVAGGCNGDYVKIDAEGNRTTITGVDGERNLVFDNFDGNFNADLRLFSTATFKNGTDVAFTDSRVNLWAVSTWNFEFGSSFSNLLANDFEKDTLNFDVTGLTTESNWTVGSGAVAAFDDLADATAVYFGSSAATYDEENACWTDGTYKLALSDAKTDMIVSKIA